MNDVSVILNVYKRPETLEKQIKAIKGQTHHVNSEDIHVWYNTPTEGDFGQLLPDDEKIKTYECNYNTKFFGRFTLPLLCRTKYVAIFDDDVIPGKRWFENCINILEKQGDAILGGSGVITNGKTYIPNDKIGWNGMHSHESISVDLVGHAWFFKQEHAKLMWIETPPSWENGEDMFLSYMAQKIGLKTIVPPHPGYNSDFWSNVPEQSSTNGLQWGFDDKAHSLTNMNHLVERDNIVKELKQRGWKTIRI